jgi:molecular chaperone GrpE
MSTETEKRSGQPEELSSSKGASPYTSAESGNPKQKSTIDDFLTGFKRTKVESADSNPHSTGSNADSTRTNPDSSDSNADSNRTNPDSTESNSDSNRTNPDSTESNSDSTRTNPDSSDSNADSTRTNPDSTDSNSDSGSSTADSGVELEEMQKKYLYLLSEFENFKRRSARERLDLFKNASKDLLVELLPVLDDFERGLTAMEQATEVTAVKTGVDLVYQKFRGILQSRGLQPISAVGLPFDTELHEAISQAPAVNEESKNTVLVEVEKGYKLNEQVVRYAKVIVAV